MISIAVDLDTTLNNMEQKWIKRYNEIYNDNLEMFTDWDITKFVKPECGDKIFDILGEPNFFFECGIKEYAADVMQYLNDNYDIYIVTAYTANACVDKIRWIEKYLPFFDKKKVVFCNHKGLINTDWLIDDGPHNLEAFKNKKVIFDMPYNQCVHINDAFVAFDWIDIGKIFKTN